ncbi:hypothetical protein Mal4_31250 [Maioricimonas rarisocia]|uniref:Uncharacterized protein n=1 Tax=Maioricimonas rarisocia TaxID=2528026 RepID=A0A517Z8K4_9PLAN|nr:hypothetical protein [Maioricimonas rarisocia]QDU38795.1 hypothetical protein Mal4_31250 [Maioricimonas rarisocia]
MLTEIVDALSDELAEHWVKMVTAALFMGVGWYFGRRRAHRQWEKREFFDRLNISLNRISDGTLRIRTLVEKSCEDIFLNSVAANRLIATAQKTTADDPIVPLDKDENWLYLNAVLNEISEKFAAGQLYLDMGLPTRTETYLICLTNECEGALRTRKIRAMVVRRSLLTNLPETAPRFEHPNHATRWRTLGQLASQYARDPERFLEVEIAVPAAGAANTSPGRSDGVTETANADVNPVQA